MKNDEMQKKQHKTFSDICHTDDSGVEFWYARAMKDMKITVQVVYVKEKN